MAQQFEMSLQPLFSRGLRKLRSLRSQKGAKGALLKIKYCWAPFGSLISVKNIVVFLIQYMLALKDFKIKIKKTMRFFWKDIQTL